MKIITVAIMFVFINLPFVFSDIIYTPNIYDSTGESAIYIDDQHKGGSLYIAPLQKKSIFIISSHKLSDIGVFILNNSAQINKLDIKLGRYKSNILLNPAENKILWIPCGEPLFNTNYFYELHLKNYGINKIYIFFTTDYYRMALLCIEKCYYANAISLLNNIVNENPGSIEPFLYLAMAYYYNGYIDKAREIFSKIEINPEYGNYLKLPKTPAIDTPVMTLIPRAHLSILTGIPVDEGMYYDKECFKSGTVVYGPYKRFPKGIYKVEYWLKSDDVSIENKIAKIDIAAEGYVIKKLEVNGTDFKKKNEFQPFTLDFYNPDSTKELEFRVYATGNGNLWVKEIDLKVLGKESLNENITETHLAWAKMFLEDGDLSKASRKTQIAVNSSPKDIESKLLLASILKLQSNRTGAIEQYKYILEIAPNYEEALIELKSLYESLNEHNKLEEVNKKIKELTPSSPSTINIGDIIEFRGYSIEETELKTGGRFKIIYFWKPIKFSAQNYMFFVHFRYNGNGKIIFQNDHYLQELNPSPYQYTLGEILKEEYIVNIPKDAPKGEYDIVIGVWRPELNMRTSIKNTTNNEIEIGRIKID